MRRSAGRTCVAVGLGLLMTACTETVQRPSVEAPVPEGAAAGTDEDRPSGTVTLAFAGDVHFQLHLDSLLSDPGAGLGPMSRALRSADVAMVNLESAITERGAPEAKELERPEDRYHFRTSPAALDFLAEAGVDVVSVGNNHGADYGARGLADTLRAARDAPVAVIGAGRDQQAAFTPHRITVGDTDLAFLAADASPREGASSVWAAGEDTPGIAAARGPRPAALLDAVRTAGDRGDVVVVYLHWGRALQTCPTPRQRTQAQALSRAGADVVVGSHAHVPLGAGWQQDTYVSYGLGNFVWYHDRQSETGVLRLRIRDGEVDSDRWVPARIGTWGRPRPVRGAEGRRAIADWEQLRGCARLDDAPGGGAAPAPEYESTVRPIGPALRSRMRAGHRAGCPVRLRDLRHLQMSYVGFDGKERQGEMVVAAEHARDVTRVFRRLFDARWPIRRMRLVDAYGGDDNRSMAANNSSAYNCRRVAGSRSWSAHAYGSAIDLNPVQNPYVTGSSILPPAGRPYAAVGRGPDARPRPGVIRADDVVVDAFTDIGWEWGGTWSDPDYQHFVAPQ